LASLLKPAAVFPGILFRVLPSREAVIAAFKKDPKNQLSAFSSQLVLLLSRAFQPMKNSTLPLPPLPP
jgi:hypothetical protein